MHVISRKAGKAPGTMLYVGPRRTEPTIIESLSYNIDSLKFETIDPGRIMPSPGGSIRLIMVQGVHDIEAVRSVAEKFGVNPLIMEDIVNTRQRPKVEWDGQNLFLTMKTCYVREATGRVELEQVSFFVSRNTVLCFRQNKDDLAERIRVRLQTKESRIRASGTDYLLYVLVDYLVDNYFTVLEKMEAEQDALQEEMIFQPEQKHLEHIFRLRSDTSSLRQTVWPMRDILNAFLNREMDFMKAETRVFFKDIHDHCLYIMDSLEIIREMNLTLQEVYLSMVSHRMNSVMKLLAVIATIFIPLTFLAGVYGMNFEYMPELSWKAGYFICLGLMAGIGIGLAVFFKYKKWF